MNESVKLALNELVERSNALAANYDNSIMVDNKTILAVAEAFRELQQRAEVAEAAVDIWRKESAYNLEGKNDAREYIRELEGKLEALEKQQPIGRVDRGAATDSNEYPDARVVCLHEQVGWEAFQDGCELFTRPAPAVCMEKPEPYAWLVHAPQGDYVERNPDVVAHLEGTGLTKCKPLYLGL